jgi:hypothetical protein
VESFQKENMERQISPPFSEKGAVALGTVAVCDWSSANTLLGKEKENAP